VGETVHDRRGDRIVPITRKAVAGLTTLAAAGALAAASAPAHAAAPTECVKRDNVASHFFCPLNSANVPVYAAPGSKRQVGTLRQGGLANWFDYQVRGPKATRGRFSNVWWAHTQADRVNGRPGAKGYVPEVYFSGGGAVTDDPANGLPVFTEGSTPGVSVPSGPRP
jgi:hypothetical protein